MKFLGIQYNITITKYNFPKISNALQFNKSSRVLLFKFYLYAHSIANKCSNRG